jgi:DNA topoisomerase-1
MKNSALIIKFPVSRLEALKKDPVKCASLANLIYVNDKIPGIKRIKKGKKFEYWLGERKLRNKKQLDRIRKLVIPPAWKNVWICPKENGHLQVTGLDVNNRKQYKYHALWNCIRDHAKYAGLYGFGRILPRVRSQLEKDLALPGLCQRKVLALVVSLMERTNIRIGNEVYEKLYGSHGLTTLKDKHVRFSGSDVQFTFTGKKGVKHRVSIHHKRFAALVKKCRDVPGKELFQYIDDNNNHKPIDSMMVNDYIKEISGSDFSAKDFRTWWGTINALLAFKQVVNDEDKGKKRKIVEVMDHVAKRLGNTPTVCKKYYVHPIVIDLFERDELARYFKIANGSRKENKLSSAEKTLVRILEKAS